MNLVQTLNSLNSQVWAFLLVLMGGLYILAFHKAGIDVGIAAGVMGAGVNMFTSAAKAQADPHPEAGAQDAATNRNPQQPAEPAR